MENIISLENANIYQKELLILKNVDFIINKLGKISGPILIFTQNYQKDAGYLKFLPKLLPLPDKQKWEVYSS